MGLLNIVDTIAQNGYKDRTVFLHGVQDCAGRGSRFISKDGRTHYFISTKARSLYHQKIKPVKLTWTMAWRAYNKKIKVDELQKKKSRKTTRIQKAVVGMSIEEIRRKKAESREDRDKAAEQLAKDVKDRKAKQMQAKKADKGK